MTVRREVSAVLGRLSFAYEVMGRQGGRSFAAAAWSIRSLREDIEEMYAAERLTEVRGVGPRVVGIIGEVLEGNTPALLTELEAQIPEGLYKVGKVPGLGPKKVRVLWQELGITTLGELEYACNENRLLDLKGFGPKTQAKVLAGIEQVRSYAGLCRLDQGGAIAAALLSKLDGAVVGKLRRSCELLDGVDLLVRGDPTKGLVAAGLQPDSVEVAGIPLRIHVCTDPELWGVHLALRTGSEGHVAKLVARATERGFTLDTDGLRDTGGARVPCPDEETLYHALDVHVPAAERREDHVSLVARSESGPRFIRRADLVGALHNHTTASDGVNTLEEMRDAAAAAGLAYFGVSDHSQSAF